MVLKPTAPGCQWHPRPSISEYGTSNKTSKKKHAYITSTILHMLQELRRAKQLRDKQYVKALRLLALSPIRSCSGSQPNSPPKNGIKIIMRKNLANSTIKAHERQALRYTVQPTCNALLVLVQGHGTVPTYG